MKVSVIIPALNEEQAIAKVITAIPMDIASEVIVVDNGSTDQTPQAAAAAGARVVHERVRGYGAACLKGIASLDSADVVVFLDADYSDFPQEMRQLVQPIALDKADLVIGSRVLGRHQQKALPRHAEFGNRLASVLMWWLFRYRYTDLGPFRAIRYSALKSLQMQDRNFGWTVEMQIKAVRHRLRVTEIPVSYRKRIGESKISGTVLGSIKAASKILWTIFKYGLQARTS